MEDFSRCLGFNMTVLLICCILWIFSSAERITVTEVAGNTVNLSCTNISQSSIQVTWKMNGDTLFTFISPDKLHKDNKTKRLNINMSLSDYALIITRVQKFHTGNYTCEITGYTGAWEQEWELIITEQEEVESWNKLMIVLASVVPSGCCLMFLSVFVIRRLKIQCAGESRWSHTGEAPEVIYANTLKTSENQQHSHHQSSLYNARSHLYEV